MVLVITGKSGTGKTYIGNILEEVYGFKKIVTYTTRKQRYGECDGKDYFFVSDKKFDSMNFSETTEVNGKRYGRPFLPDDVSTNNYYVIVTNSGIQNIINETNDFKIVKLVTNEFLRLKRLRNRKESWKKILKRNKSDRKEEKISIPSEYSVVDTGRKNYIEQIERIIL